MSRHGMTGTPTWKIWRGIIKRCTQINCSRYPYYGGRGIQICNKWLSFEGFYEDMGDRPDGLTIERTDVNGDYCKENCKWVSAAEQKLNTRRTHWVEIDSKKVALSVACKIKGANYSRVIDRINKLGWTPERALSEGKRVNQYL